MDKYYQNNEFKQLLLIYEEMLSGNSGEFLEAEELTEIARYFHNVGKDEKVIEALNLAEHLYPNDLSPILFKARLALLVENNIPLAMEIAETIIDKTDFEYIYLRGEILIVDDKVEEANNLFEEYLEDHVDVSETEDYAFDVATIFADYGEIEFAEKWLELVHKQEDNDYKELIAQIHQLKGEYKACETILENLIDADPYSGSYWNQLAQVQLSMNNTQEAMTSSEYAIAINPDDDEAILNKANALFALSNYPDALVYYQRYREICPKSHQSSIDVAIGHIYLYLNDIHKAQQMYLRAIAEAQDKSLTLVQIGVSVFDNGYIRYAYHILGNLLPTLGSSWNLAFAQLARCCYELNKRKEFQTYLKIAVERNPEESAEVLGDLYPEGTKPSEYPNIDI